jgi:hypothetical protein
MHVLFRSVFLYAFFPALLLTFMSSDNPANSCKLIKVT